MSEGQPDLQSDLLSAARAVVRFQVQNELPKLRELVAVHRDSVTEIESAKQKLSRLASAIRNQEFCICQRFAQNDVTAESIDLLAWREVAKLGQNAVQLLEEQAIRLERELREFIKAHKGVSDCLEIDSSSIAWSKSERDNFEREFQFESSQATPEARKEAA